ncbi:MAG: serine hydrolase [Vagococcus sp.]
MKKKVWVLLGMIMLLMIVSVMSIKKVKLAVAKSNDTNVEVASISSDNQVIDKQSKLVEKTIFEEEQVVTKEMYPKKDLNHDGVSEDVLPKGTVVSVEKVANNDEWVRIISDPEKGYIPKDILESRSISIKERETKRKAELSKSEFETSMDKALETFLKEKGGDVSIYVETVDKQHVYEHQGDKVNRTASSIKLPFIAYVMTLIDQGKLNENTPLTFTENYRMDGTGIIQFEPAGKQYTIKELSELVIRYSDNVAYIMLLNHVGESAFIQFLSELDSQSPNNRVFSSARILSKAMAFVNQEKDKNKQMALLYGWLQDSIFDDGVAVGLPGVDVAHKTGWMPMYSVSNDISLIKDDKRPYYLTIMTNGYDTTYSEKAIADIAQLVDEHMLRLK